MQSGQLSRSGYRNKRVLVTGGLGFIGSNLVLALVHEGAEVTVVDAAIEGCGANDYNLAPVQGLVRFVRANIADSGTMAEVLSGQEVIFNVAGEVSHTNSVKEPERDLALNAADHLRFLQHCRRWAPRARIVYTSSRQVYGRPQYLPVDEDHPVSPCDYNGVHKWAAECYHRLQAVLYGQPAVALRLTNVYGPRQALQLPWQGFIATFVRRALQNEPIVVFGDGRQLRDMLYVDDAVEALLLAGLAPLPAEPPWFVANVGGPAPLTLAEIARTVAGDNVRFIPFPDEQARIDIGSYYSDSRRFQEWTGWKPRVHFAEGLARTLEFYRSHAEHYLQDHVHPVR